MTGKSDLLVVSCVAHTETRSSDHINKSVIITTCGERPLQIQIVGNHTFASTKGYLQEKKSVVNKKTTKIETRVQRQVVLENDRVVADTGPQVISRRLEDKHSENCEDGSNRTSQSNPEEKSSSPMLYDPSVVRTISRTKTSKKSASKEVSHYHDENRREVTNSEELAEALKSPEILLEKIENVFPEEIIGELKFYSNKSQSVTNQEKVEEISKLDKEGNIRTAITRTCLQEETSGEEVPEQFVPRELPNLDSLSAIDALNQDHSAIDVHILPISRDSWSERVTRPVAPLTMTSAYDKHRDDSRSNESVNEKSQSWSVERKTGKDGEPELVSVKRQSLGKSIWDRSMTNRPSIRSTTSNSKRHLSPRRSTQVTRSTVGRRTAERRQRLLLDGYESCPPPPPPPDLLKSSKSEKKAEKDEEEFHYELLWNAHTGERRSPSPTKSETFTKSRGRKIAQILATRREQFNKSSKAAK